MPSNAGTELHVALSDVDKLLEHAKSFGGGVPGAPKSVAGQSRPGRPFTRAATVTLAGALEAFFESLALEAGALLHLDSDQLKDVKNFVTRMHGIGPDKVHALYAMLGCPFILDTLSWQKMPKGTVRTRVAELHRARNKIAHGRAPQSAQVSATKAQRAMVESLAKAMERAVAAHIKKKTGSAPAW